MELLDTTTIPSSKDLLSINEAAAWASKYLSKIVTPSNISYLLQYGRVKRYSNNGTTLLDQNELKKYYSSYLGKREINWKNQLGHDIDWHLSFDYLREADTTKHVHRLHPYKGKFIPQLVEYFLDNHTDEFKKNVYFKKGDIILDPFCGSGTTLIQASELGMHAIGIDVSSFNAFMCNVKLGDYNFLPLLEEIRNVSTKLKKFISDSKTIAFESELLEELSKYNNKYFPVPKYKYMLRNNTIDEDVYGYEKEKEFLKTYDKLIEQYNIQLKQSRCDSFLDKWYSKHIRKEIDYVFSLIKNVSNTKIKHLLSLILSRTIRSCRATTHSDLATLKEPVLSTYYCSKHGKICKPLFSILGWWERYCADTISRLEEFKHLRTNTFQKCLVGDSRTIDIVRTLELKDNNFARRVAKQGINGIFSSPPYVGLIDYHEQHAYAYDLFGFKKRDSLEIGPLSKGQGREARLIYADEISKVLLNCKKFLVPDYNIFLVANDKFQLYPSISDKANMKIVNQYRRPVLNRTERDKAAYSETIFHLKEK